MSTLNFTKMHGLGNDFIVVDNLNGQFIPDPQRLQRLSDRRTGVGFDQCLVVEQPSVETAEFDYRIYNADGGEVEHCGNGARCFARFVTDRGLTSNSRIRVNTCNGLLELVLHNDGQVTVQMGIMTFTPKFIPFVAEAEQLHYALEVNGETYSVCAAAIGNPHVLLPVESIAGAPVEELGAVIECHPRFPRRVNVGFMQILDRQHIKLRVFERGVGETRACGSGACAAAAIGHRQGLLDRQVRVALPGGELDIVWPADDEPIEMTGPCSTVYEGQTKM